MANRVVEAIYKDRSSSTKPLVDVIQSELSILIAIAYRANKDTLGCSISIQHLIDFCGVSRKTVYRSIASLKEKGIILIDPHPEVNPSERKTSQQYVINILSFSIESRKYILGNSSIPATQEVPEEDTGAKEDKKPISEKAKKYAHLTAL